MAVGVRPLERRAACGHALGRALLGTPEGLSFEELHAACPDAAPGELAAWLGHALTEGLLDDVNSPDGVRVFRLRARGRRLLSSRRRRAPDASAA